MTIYNKDEKTGELYHYGIKGQHWGVRRYQNEDGTYTEEGLKIRKKAYKEHIKNAKSEYRRQIKDSGKNHLLKNKMEQEKAIDKVDSFAKKKSNELYNEYRKLKIYESNLKGINVKLKPKIYFSDIGLDPGILDISYPTLNVYKVYDTGDSMMPNAVKKRSYQFYSM